MKTEAELTIDVEEKQLMKNKSNVVIRLSSEVNLIVLTPKEVRQLTQELLDKAAICAMNNDTIDNRTK